MAQKSKDQRDEPDENSATQPKDQPVLTRQVVVTRFDSPPPSGKKEIHPRRPAPIVPTRDERIKGRPADDADPGGNGDG
jgi:hypothetical protein